MSNHLDIPALERPSFFDGQQLTASDLADVQTFHRELRWLHNRSLHNWGIAFGYVVTGSRGQREVQVQPGYALDCKGRELILSESLNMPIPPVAGDKEGNPAHYYLTSSYAEDDDLTPETRTGTCGTSGAVRRPEEPLIRWQDPDAGYQHGLDIVLASIKVQNCQLAEDISSAERRDAIPAQQPYVAAGKTISGNTPWELWTMQTPAGEQIPIGVATKVVTSTAGFRTIPRYQAHVIGQRVFEQEIGDGDQRISAVVDGYAQVTDPTPSSFELRVLLTQGIITESAVLNPPVVRTVEFMSRLRSDKEPDGLAWYVVWMGIEG